MVRDGAARTPARVRARARLCTRRRTHACALEMRRRTGVVIVHLASDASRVVSSYPTPARLTSPQLHRAEGRVHAQVHKLAELEAACEVASAARLAGMPEPQHAANATTLLGSFGGSTGTADAPEAAADARALLAMLQACSGADRRVAAPAWQHGATRGNAVQHLAGLHPSESARRRASQCGIAAPDP
jgi:hypothetical protein